MQVHLAPQTVNADMAARDSAVESVVILLSFFRLPANAAQLHRELAGDHIDAAQLVRLLRRLGLKSQQVRVLPARLDKTPLPAIAVMRDGTFMLLGKIAEGLAVVQDSRSGQVHALPLAEFEAQSTGDLVLATRRAAPLGAGGKFDIAWFLPAFMKYRRLIGEVLLISLFLQLFALISPLFFQVVMDKVLVHQSMSTLKVLVIGLVTVSMFEVVMGACARTCSRTPPIASMWNLARSCSGTCWHCRLRTFSRVAPARRLPASVSSTAFANSSQALRSRW